MRFFSGFSVVLVLSSIAYAGELASYAPFTVSGLDDLPCSSSMPLIVSAPSEEQFTGNTQQLLDAVASAAQKLSATCTNLSSVDVSGEANFNWLFKGHATRDTDWQLAVTKSYIKGKAVVPTVVASLQNITGISTAATPGAATTSNFVAPPSPVFPTANPTATGVQTTSVTPGTTTLPTPSTATGGIPTSGGSTTSLFSGQTTAGTQTGAIPVVSGSGSPTSNSAFGQYASNTTNIGGSQNPTYNSGGTFNPSILKRPDLVQHLSQRSYNRIDHDWLHVLHYIISFNQFLMESGAFYDASTSAACTQAADARLSLALVSKISQQLGLGTGHGGTIGGSPSGNADIDKIIGVVVGKIDEVTKNPGKILTYGADVEAWKKEGNLDATIVAKGSMCDDPQFKKFWDGAIAYATRVPSQFR